MANRDAPMGFIPVEKLDGSKIPTRKWKINSATSNIFVGDAVSKDAGGGVELSTASDGILIVGVVEQLLDSNEVPIGHPNSSISTKYVASGSSGIAIVSLAVQDAVFSIQANGNTVEADIWNTAPMVVTGGDTTTARSKTELNTSSQSTSGAEELMIIGKVDEPGNAWGTNVNLLVTFLESTWIGNGDPVGV